MNGSSSVAVGFGTPTSTTVPARSRASKACLYTAGSPIASMHTSAPLPSVTDLMYSTGSCLPALTVWVAPNCLAHSSFWSSRSTAMIFDAPARYDPAIAASPTPPQPNTATESPRPTLPVFMAAPRPAMTPQPSNPAAVAGASGSTGVHCPECTSVFSTKAPMPSAGESTVPSVSVIFWVALYVEKHSHGLPLRQLRQLPQTARQLRIT